MQCTAIRIWKFQYPILVLMAYYIYSIYKNIKNYKASYEEESFIATTVEVQFDREDNEVSTTVTFKQLRRTLLRMIVEDAILSFTCIILLVYATQVVKIPFYVVILPMIIAFSTKFLMQRWPKTPCESMMHASLIFNSIFRIIVL